MSTQLTKQQLQALGMDTMMTGKREAFLENIGRTIFDSALVRLLETLTDDQIHSLNYAIDATDSFEAVVEYVSMTYPHFIEYMQEVQDRFIGECMQQMQQPA